VVSDEEFMNTAACCDRRRERLRDALENKYNKWAMLQINYVMPLLSSKSTCRSTPVDSTFIVRVSACVRGDFVVSGRYTCRQEGLKPIR